MSLDIDMLRSSFTLVVEREPELTRRFYEILFTRYPQARALFPANDLRPQQTMLRDALVAVMEHLEDAPWLTQTLGELGRRHEGYGVTAPMYDWVGDSLLATLAEVAGEDWTEPMANAWAAAYGAIASLMQAGAAASPEAHSA